MDKLHLHLLRRCRYLIRNIVVVVIDVVVVVVDVITESTFLLRLFRRPRRKC